MTGCHLSNFRAWGAILPLSYSPSGIYHKNSTVTNRRITAFLWDSFCNGGVVALWGWKSKHCKPRKPRKSHLLHPLGGREAAASALAMAAKGEWKISECKGARGPSRETLSLTAEVREGERVLEVSVSGYQDQSCRGTRSPNSSAMGWGQMIPSCCGYTGEDHIARSRYRVRKIWTCVWILGSYLISSKLNFIHLQNKETKNPHSQVGVMFRYCIHSNRQTLNEDSRITRGCSFVNSRRVTRSFYFHEYSEWRTENDEK